jgi:hypothetical protein
LHSSSEALSPIEIERKLELGDEHGDKLSTVSYHVATLARYKTISLVDEQPVRGAMEHFYESRVSESRWVRDLLKRMQDKDEALLCPKGGVRAAKKARRKNSSGDVGG